MNRRQKTFIIAEAGINHNGSLKIAKKLIDLSKKAGADAVKFQTFKSKDVISKFASKLKYQKKNEKDSESQQEMLKKFELPYKDYEFLKKYCQKKKKLYLCRHQKI